MKRPSVFALLSASLAGAVLLGTLSGCGRAEKKEKICRNNLRILDQSIRLYSTDYNDWDAPPQLGLLIKGDFLTVPEACRCPLDTKKSSGNGFYTSYIYTADAKKFVLTCPYHKLTLSGQTDDMAVTQWIDEGDKGNAK